MIIFIDESGDPGFTFARGSSETFVIACLIFEDELEIEKTAVAVKDLRRKLGLSDTVEFKFNKSSKQVRLAFLRTISRFSFTIRVLVVHKKLIKSKQLRSSKNSFYSYFIKMVLKNNGGNILNAKVRIDGSGDRVFRRNFLTYLRKELNSKNMKLIKDIKFIDSKSNVMIQVADMLAGVIRRYKEETKDDAVEYWDIISKKIDDCWDFR
ncbi:MAG: hypothetical protein ACD_22C00259G0005 [uncultured bacterium]|nr:MAG: hypothetical protein ACD_22C00259G0005 [uncultured bacterium]